MLGVYSRCGLHTRAVTKTVTVIRRLQTFRLLHACSGCFRLERSPGGACTRWKSAALSRRTWTAAVPDFPACDARGLKVAGLHTVGAAPLQVRVGIVTGLVVVGDRIGEGEARERSVVGETARLQALAEPGTVVIAPSTRRLTGGLFDYEDVGPVEVKGWTAPVVGTRVLRESGTESWFEALRAIAVGSGLIIQARSLIRSNYPKFGSQTG